MHSIYTFFLLFGLLTNLPAAAREFTADSTNFGTIPDGTSAASGNYGAARDVSFVVSDTEGTVDSVSLNFSVNHASVGNLRVTLIAPSGQSHLLLEPASTTPPMLFGSSKKSKVHDYSFGGAAALVDSSQPTLSSVNSRFRRVQANGRWLLRFQDGVVGGTGEVIRAALKLTTAGSNQTVTKAEDTNDGVCNTDCSLREAITSAADGDLVTFDPVFFNSPRVIVLSGLPLSISNKSLAITGPGAHKLTISGNNRSGLLNNFSSGNVVTLSGLRFTAGKIQGSAIVDFGVGAMVITGCDISDNFATYVVQVNGNAEIYSSTIANNLAPVAIYAKSLRMERSTIFGNNSSFGVSSMDGTIVDSTIIANTGVGINSREGDLSLRNTVVAQNQTDLEVVKDGTITSLGYNFIGNRGSFAATFNQPGDQSGTEFSPLDPKLGPLSHNGGTVPTLAPLMTSQLIDQGNANGFDARGVARQFDLPAIAPAVSGNNSDIGAVEIASILVTNLGDNGPGSLRQALVDAPASPAVSDIWFAPNLTVTPSVLNLTSGELAIDRNIAIHGPSAQKLTISAGSRSRVLVLKSDRRASISSMTLTQGDSGTFSDGIGGAAVNRVGSHLSLINCGVTNSVSSQGAGVYNYGSLVVRGCAVSGNRGTGAITSHQDALAVLADSTIHNNNVIGSGAVSFNGADGQLSNMTITDQGIGLLVSFASVAVRNSVIAGNNIDVSVNQATLNSHGHNFIGKGWPVPTFELLTDQLGTFSEPLNPRLGPLMVHSGEVLTRIPRANSRLLDRGLRLGTRDQRGLPGVVDISSVGGIVGGNNADIGAVEAHAILVSNTNDSGPGSLRQAMLDANENGIGTNDILFGTPAGLALQGIIQLQSRLAMPMRNVNLIGPGANLLSVNRVDSAPRFGLLDSSNRVHVGISGLTFSGGFDDGVVASGNNSVGGGIDVRAGELHLAQVQITGCQARENGGGVSLINANGVITDSSIFANGSSSDGGGVFFGGENAHLRIEQTTISGNFSSTIGAAGIAVIAASNQQSQLRLEAISSTVAKNRGRGIYTSSFSSGSTAVTELRNTLFSENSSGNLFLDTLLGPGRVESLGHNLSDTNDPLLDQPTDRVNAIAKLGALTENGGSTLTHAPQFGSDAIDAGILIGRLQDARGQKRPNDIDGVINAPGSDGSDIGAVELDSPRWDLIFSDGFE